MQQAECAATLGSRQALASQVRRVPASKKAKQGHGEEENKTVSTG